MKKTLKNQLITVIGVLITAVVFGQSPEIDNWMLNSSGHLAQYNSSTTGGTTIVDLNTSSDIKTVCYDNDHVYVTCEGLGSYIMGGWNLPIYPSGQAYTYKIPRNPAEETGTKTAVPFGGQVAYAVNGVPMYGYESADSWDGTDNTSSGMNIWNSDAWVNEGDNMDATGGGHADGTGTYHYHATPFTLYDFSNSTTHSPIIGWAPDGYPYYGPHGYSDPLDAGSSIQRIQSGYSIRSMTDRTTLPDGSTLNPPEYGPSITAYALGTYVEDYEYNSTNGDLDVYNGRECVTPEYPGGTYAYFLPVDASGDPAFPYFFAAEFYGQVNTSDLSNIGSATEPAGLSCSALGIETKMVQKLEIKLSPNPVSGSLSIELNEMDLDGATIRFTDNLGQTIYSVRGGVTKAILVDVSNWANGIYFCSLEGDDGSKYVTKFIVATN